MLNEQTQMFEVFLRRELPRTIFTYIDAVEELIKLNDDLMPDWIYMDRGAGDVQYEMMMKHGMIHPSTGLTSKVIANQLAEKTNVIDIYTGKAVKMPIKPTMINNAALVFEKEKIALNPIDRLAQDQIEEFKIKRTSSHGNPIYEDGNDHIIDALSRALFGFAKQYDDIFKRTLITSVRFIDALDSEERYTIQDSKSEKRERESDFKLKTLGTSGADGIQMMEPIESSGMLFSRRSMNNRKMPTRKTF